MSIVTSLTSAGVRSSKAAALAALLLLVVVPAIAAEHQHEGTRAVERVALRSARAKAVVTPLADGSVLVTGGQGTDGRPVGTTERIKDGESRPAASLRSARTGHTATLLADGRVVIAGGEVDGRTTNVVEVISADGTSAQAIGTLAIARRFHTATLLGSGDVLIAGGNDGRQSVNTLEVFEARTNRLRMLPATLATAREEHTASLLPDGRVLFVGGRIEDRALASTEYFDPERQAVTAGPDLARGRYRHAAAAVERGNVFVSGGTDGLVVHSDGEVILPADGKVDRLVFPADEPRMAHQLIVLAGSGNVVVVGGENEKGSVGSIDLVDPLTFQVSRMSSEASRDGVAYASTVGMLWSVGIAGHAEGVRYPTIRTTAAQYRVGERITIEGENWPAGEVVTLGLTAGVPDLFAQRRDRSIGATHGVTFVHVKAGADGRVMLTDVAVPASSGRPVYIHAETGTSKITALTRVITVNDATGVDPATVTQTSQSTSVTVVGTNLTTGYTVQVRARIVGPGIDTTLTLSGGYSATAVTVPLPTAVSNTVGSYTVTLSRTDQVPYTYTYNCGSYQCQPYSCTYTCCWSCGFLGRSTCCGSCTGTCYNTCYYTCTGTSYNYSYPTLAPVAFSVVSPATTTVLTQSSSTSVFGEPVTFTATVSGTSTPSGTVSFNEGPVTHSFPETLSNGVATKALTLAVGSHSIVAAYSGAPGFAASTSDAVTHTVTKATPVVNINYGDLSPVAVYNGLPHEVWATVRGVGGADLQPVVVTYNGSETRPVDAGTYAVVVSFAGNDSYEPATGTAQLTIRKANATVTLSALTYAYDGTSKSATASTVPDGLPLTITYDGGTTLPVNAGTYQVSASFAGSSNYEPANASGTFTITRVSPTVTVTGGTFTYDQAAHPATGSVTGIGGAVLGTPVFTYNGGTAAPVNAGTYNVVASFAGDTNYDAASATAEIVIQKAQVSFAVPGQQTFVYDGTPKAVPYTFDGLRITYQGSVNPPVNAGLYAVNVTMDNPNYFMNPMEFSWTITKAAATLTLSALSQTYDGTPRNAAVTSNPAGLEGTAIAYEGSVSAPINAGSYAVQATLTNANYEATPASGTLVVDKATPVVSVIGGTFTYDAIAHAASGSVVGAGGASLGSPSFTYNGNGAAPADAGTYAVVGTYTGDANHSGATGNATIVINKAVPAVSVTGGTFTYDGAAHPATGSVTGVGGAPLGTPVFTYDGGSVAPVNAGTYVVAGSFAGNTNYEAASGSAQLVINKASATIALSTLSHTYDGTPKAVSFSTTPSGLAGVTIAYAGSPSAPVNAGSYGVTASLLHANYQAEPVAATLTIAKASATLSLSALSHTYDGTPRSVTVTSIPAGLAGVSVTYDGAGAAPVNAGSYAVVAMVSDSNYEASPATGTLVIARAPANVTVSGGTYVYDGTAKSAAGSATGVAGETLGALVFTYDGGATAPIHAGNYAVTGTFAGNGNYLPGAANATLTISRAIPSITVNGGTFTYDGNAHGATGSASGVNGEPLGALTFTYGGSASVPVNAGRYAVTGSFAGNGDYEPRTATAEIVINRAAAAIALASLTHTYDGSAKAASIATTPAGLSGVTVTYDGAASAPVNAGSYSVRATLSDANYEAPAIEATLTIARAAATLALSQLTYVYDGTARHASVETSPSGLQGVIVTYDGATNGPVNAGTYAVAATLVNPNYDAQAATGVLTIAKATATLSLSSLAHSYDGTAKTAVASIVPAGVTGLTVTYDGASAPPVHAGSYAVVARLSNPNYEAADATATLVIAKAATSIAAPPTHSVVFGEQQATVSGRLSSTAGVPSGGIVIVLDGVSKTVAVGTDGSFSATFGAASFGVEGNPYAIRYSFVGDTDFAAVTASSALHVTPRVAASALLAPARAQYSDRVTFTATLHPDVVNGAVPAKSATFRIGSRVLGTVPLSAAGGNLSASLSLALHDSEIASNTFEPAAKNVEVVFGGVNGNFSVVPASASMTIEPEDARAAYAGITYMTTGCATCATARVTLRAIVRDISSTDAAAGDDAAGDIRRASVTFVDRIANAPIATVPLTLLDSSDRTSGVATHEWNVDLGDRDAADLRVGIVVGGYYARDAAVDDALVTVTRPTGDESVSGGGQMTIERPAGSRAANAGSVANFGFSLTRAGNGKNARGHISLLYRRGEADGEHVYQINMNNIDSLAVSAAGGGRPAAFSATGKAALQRAGTGRPAVVESNVVVQIEGTDRSSSGEGDSVVVSVWDRDGLLLFTTAWDGSAPVQQPIAGGNVVIR